MMLIIVVCAVLGVVCAALLGVFYEQGVIVDSLLSDSITLADFQLVIFFVWLLFGAIMGVMKN